jgi:hypothetical protein
MKKYTIRTLIGLGAIIIIAGIYVYMNMNSIAARAIERVGTSTLQSGVSVDAVNIDMGNRKIVISGVTIANPEGFSGDRAVYLGQVAVRANALSMDRLDLAFIDVRDPSVHLEINDKGTNLGVLQANAASGGGSRADKSPESAPEDASTAPAVVIDRFALKKPKLFVSVPQLQQKAGPIGMQEITIRGIGSKDQPKPVYQATAQVLNKVIKVAMKKAAQQGYLGELQGSVLDKLRRRGTVGGSFLNQLDSNMEDAGSSIRDAIGP